MQHHHLQPPCRPPLPPLPPQQHHHLQPPPPPPPEEIDPRLHAVYEQSGESGKSFDYSQSLKTTTESIAEQQMTAYLSKIQRGGHIQPFGCMIAIDNSNFRVIDFSDNAIERLGLAPQSVPSLEKPDFLTIGTDVKTLFTPSSAVLLERAFRAREITLLNPVWVHSMNTLKNTNGFLGFNGGGGRTIAGDGDRKGGRKLVGEG